MRNERMELQERGKMRGYTVTWYCNAVRVSKITLDLGYCEYGRGVAFIVVKQKNVSSFDIVKPFVVIDVIVDESGCSDAEWCFNLKCPLNKANLRHFKKYGVRTMNDLKIMHERLEEIARNLGFRARRRGICVFYEKPPCTIRL